MCIRDRATGESPNTVGACSPAKFVQWEKKPTEMDVRLNGILMDRYGNDENAGYPTCLLYTSRCV